MENLQELLTKAIIIATKAHSHQFDKGGHAYILHPLSVMNKCESVEEKIVAILHDVVEDTEMTFDDLKKLGFPQYIINGIDGVTRRTNETYFDFIRRAKQNPISKVVKLHDLEDNMNISRISNPTEKDFNRLKRYEKAKNILLDKECTGLVDKILYLNEIYSYKYEELDKLKNQIKEECNKLSIDDFKKYEYKELKEILMKIDMFIDIDFFLHTEIKDLIKEKKEELYPQLKNACYYPELNKIDFLSNKEIVNLDRLLKKNSENYKPLLKLSSNIFIDRTCEEKENLIENIKDFLLKESIVEKEYVLGCNCEEDGYNCLDCLKVFLPESKLNKHRKAWALSKKLLEGNNSIEEEKEFILLSEDGFGWIDIPCLNGLIEIEFEEEMNKYIKNINLLIIKKPNLEIDKL